MSGQRVLSVLSTISKSLPAGTQLKTPTLRLIPAPRRSICLFSTTYSNRKTASNAEPHINDAKARPAEQGLRLDENPRDVGPSSCSPQTEPEEVERKLREEVNRATSENAALLSRARDFEVS